MGLGSRSQSDYVRGVTQVCGPGGNVDSGDCWDNRYGYGIKCDTWFRRDTSKEAIHVSAMTGWVVKCPDDYAVTGVCFSGSGSDCRQFSTTDSDNSAYSQVHTILECTPVAGGLGDVIKRCPGDDERQGYENSVAKIFYGAPAPSGSVYTWVCNGGSNIKDCSANLQDSRGGSTPTCRGDNPSGTEVDYNAMTMGFAAEINNQYTGRRLESEAYSDGGGALTDDQVVAGATTSTVCPYLPASGGATDEDRLSTCFTSDAYTDVDWGSTDTPTILNMQPTNPCDNFDYSDGRESSQYMEPHCKSDGSFLDYHWDGCDYGVHSHEHCHERGFQTTFAQRPNNFKAGLFVLTDPDSELVMSAERCTERLGDGRGGCDDDGFDIAIFVETVGDTDTTGSCCTAPNPLPNPQGHINNWEDGGNDNTQWCSGYCITNNCLLFKNVNVATLQPPTNPSSYTSSNIVNQATQWPLTPGFGNHKFKSVQWRGRTKLSAFPPESELQLPAWTRDGTCAPGTREQCQLLCDNTVGCAGVSFVDSAECQKKGCRLWSSTYYDLYNGIVEDAAAAATKTLYEQHGCVSTNTLGTISGNVTEDRRACPEPTTRLNTAQFGAADETTTDIKVADVDGDGRADVLVSSGRDHVRIFRGTSATQESGDFSAIVPETLAASQLPERTRQLSEHPYSRFPGDARVDTSVELANAQQIFIADFDNNGRMDLFLHSPAPSAGSCAMRCHEQGRFGYDSFEIRHANVADDDEAEPTFCYCGMLRFLDALTFTRI
jgi:hypothetical protein